MTGPYQPPGGDINSPFGPSDPTSPFPPGDNSKDEPKGDDEPSPYQGVQYELESPGVPPQTPPPPQTLPGGPGYPQPPAPPMAPAYGPPPTFAPMPPKKSGGNGLLIGGVIAGAVVLVLLVGIVFVAVAVSSNSGGGGGGDDDQAGDTYTVPQDVCSDVDLSKVEAIASFDPPASGNSNPGEYYGSGSCTGGIGSYDEPGYGYFSLRMTTSDSVTDAEDDYKRQIESSSTYMGGCEKSSASGPWKQGTIGTGSSCGGAINEYKIIMAVQDDNLSAVIALDGNSDIESEGKEAVEAVAKSMIDAAKKA